MGNENLGATPHDVLLFIIPGSDFFHGNNFTCTYICLWFLTNERFGLRNKITDSGFFLTDAGHGSCLLLGRYELNSRPLI